MVKFSVYLNRLVFVMEGNEVSDLPEHSHSLLRTLEVRQQQRPRSDPEVIKLFSG